VANYLKKGKEMDENDMKFMRVAIGLARKAREKGNHPYGAVLVDEQGEIILEAENNVIKENDLTAHAETRIIALASKQFDSDFLARCSLYASTEPCPMCAGAIFWGNVRRVVFGLSQEGLYEIIGGGTDEMLSLSCRELFEYGKKEIEVVGPILEEEAREVHIGFWN
jgi:tRNA(Arg) A34 adenosine deaminase TadA